MLCLWGLTSRESEPSARTLASNWAFFIKQTGARVEQSKIQQRPQKGTLGRSRLLGRGVNSPLGERFHTFDAISRDFGHRQYRVRYR